jgi:hypothetical protein
VPLRQPIAVSTDVGKLPRRLLSIKTPGGAACYLRGIVGTSIKRTGD